MTETTVETTETTTETTEWKPPASQADLDRIISDRLARQRAQFADYDELKAKAAQVDALEAASRTDLERAVEAAKSETKQEVAKAANARLVAAEARALAAEAKFRNPRIAVGSIDLTGVSVDENGSVDAEAIKVELKRLAESDPYLVDDGKPAPRHDKSQGGGRITEASSVARGREAYEEERRKRAAAAS